MKKLITLLFLVAFTFSVTAQRINTTTAVPWNVTTKTLSLNTVKANGHSGQDTITQHATVYWIFTLDRPFRQYFAVSVALDTVGAVPVGKTTWDVLGSMDGTNFVATAATQVRPGGTTAGLTQDTTFVLYDVATGTLWKYLKVQAVSSASLHIKGVRVSGLSIKVVPK